MPRKCCVPGCTSNYRVCNTSVFRFPKNKERRQCWVKAINRKDFIPNNDAVVCGKHFHSHFIITEDKMTRPDGSVITARRGTPTLAKDAYPTIFPDQPKYLSKKLQEKEHLQAQDEANHDGILDVPVSYNGAASKTHNGAPFQDVTSHPQPEEDRANLEDSAVAVNSAEQCGKKGGEDVMDTMALIKCEEQDVWVKEETMEGDDATLDTFSLSDLLNTEIQSTKMEGVDHCMEPLEDPLKVKQEPIQDLYVTPTTGSSSLQLTSAVDSMR